jgi:ribosomal protein S27E
MAVAASLYLLCICSGVVMATTWQSHNIDAEIKINCAQCRGHLAAGTGGRNALMKVWYGVEGRGIRCTRMERFEGLRPHTVTFHDSF